ncbi:MAG: hypothetical protein K2K56_14460 [Lachnospiraceae bacterium]|nr:hypothetical protein [Lachnospiraceae bacterium]
MIRQNCRLFRNIKQCFLTYLIFFLLSVGYILLDGLLQYIPMGKAMDIVGILQDTLSVSLVAFIIFLYVTYEYLAHGRRCFAEECLCTLPVSKNMQEGIQLIICILSGFLYTICMLGANLIFVALLHTNSLEYVWFMIRSLIVYFFLPMVIAVLLGAILSHIKNALFSYSTLVILTFYFTIRFYQMFYDAETLFGVSDLSQFFCVSANYSIQYGYLFPLDLHFVVKPFYIIGILLILLLCIFYCRRPKRRIILSQIIILIGTLGGILVWRQPDSGCYYGYCDQEDKLYSDMESMEQSAVENRFYVKEYNIELSIDSGLSAKVQMVLSDEGCSEYSFTLFGPYDVISVMDEDGNSVEYTRDGNFIVIGNEERSLKSIVICYSGEHLNRYFAGSNGIYLPGNFPFYPIAGKLPVYEQGLCELPSQESHFHVNIDCDKEVYSNLEMVSENVWEGESNNFTLVSGFWKEKEIQGIDMIYPYVSVNYNPELNAYLMDGIMKYYAIDEKLREKKVDYQMKGKKIVIAPFGYESGNYMFGSDVIIIGTRDDLDTYYLNYLLTGQWHMKDTLSDEEIQKILEDNPL